MFGYPGRGEEQAFLALRSMQIRADFTELVDGRMSSAMIWAPVGLRTCATWVWSCTRGYAVFKAFIAHSLLSMYSTTSSQVGKEFITACGEFGGTAAPTGSVPPITGGLVFIVGGGSEDGECSGSPGCH